MTPTEPQGAGETRVGEATCARCGWPERDHPMYLEPEPEMCPTFITRIPVREEGV